jgi:hypothetical protein
MNTLNGGSRLAYLLPIIPFHLPVTGTHEKGSSREWFARGPGIGALICGGTQSNSKTSSGVPLHNPGTHHSKHKKRFWSPISELD